MKTFVAVVVVLVIAVVGLGFWLGWFDVKTTKEGEKVHVDLNINKEKFQKDREKFQAEAAEKYKAMTDKLAGLREKSKGLSGDEKAKADKEIDDLTKKRESLGDKIKALEEASEEKFQELKKSITGTWEEHLPSKKP
jgi:hypothetical protein